MKQIIRKTNIRAEKGKLYYIKQLNGFLAIYSTDLKVGRVKGQLNKKTIKQQKKEEDYF